MKKVVQMLNFQVCKNIREILTRNSQFVIIFAPWQNKHLLKSREHVCTI